MQHFWAFSFMIAFIFIVNLMSTKHSNLFGTTGLFPEIPKEKKYFRCNILVSYYMIALTAHKLFTKS